MLIHDSEIVNEEEKKKHLRKALPREYAMMLAILQPDTFDASLTQIQ